VTPDLEFTLSAFKHGYKKNDAVTVIYEPLTKTFERGPGELGWQVSYVGFNNTAELLEVLVEYCDDDRETCFHIDKASKKNMKELNRKKITRPPDLDARIARTKLAARERIIARGKVEFRLDEAMMQELLERADKLRVPYGVYARMLMIKALRHES
jgi:hypothetical protein